MIDALPVSAGAIVRIAFEPINSVWRQGVRLLTVGALRVAALKSPQMDVWTDAAPPVADLTVDATDGLLRVYNVWQSGRRPGVESQSATSGMLVERLGEGSFRYSCNDIGTEPDFRKLIFRLALVGRVAPQGDAAAHAEQDLDRGAG